MIDITYKKKGISLTQVWYPLDDSYKNIKTDLFFVHGVQEKKGEGVFQTFHTLYTDLGTTEEDLMSKIHKNFRYEIRRNMKEEVVYRTYASEEILQNEALLLDCADMYQNMYAQKGMKNSLNLEQMRLYAEKGCLVITAMSQNQENLVYHTYITEGTNTRLLHSFSEFRKENLDANMIARCNKRLHWEDYLYFKARGYVSYDWGGISNPQNPNGIDEFKMRFGGEPYTYYNQYAAGSFLGKLIVWALKMKNMF